MEKLKSSLKWLDKHILKILVIGFIFIIPLYPKLPFRMVNYTYVAIRLEDFYLVLTSIVFFIQFLRGKVRIPWKLAGLFAIYWLFVFISFLWGYYVQESIPPQQFMVGFLHSLRRIEYMLIFFVVFTTIRSKKDFFLYIRFIFLALSAVSIYGIGQKFFGWPAVQTMNPEFAKGYILVLESWSRISSTFAGHYDLSAYLVLIMPILIGYYLYSKKKLYLAIFILALSALVFAGLRSSYLSYIIVVTVFLLYVRKFKLLAVVFIATALITPLSDNLTNRLFRTFQQTQVFVDSDTGETIVARDIQPDDLPPGDFGAKTDTTKIPKRQVVVVDPEEEIAAKKQIRNDIVAEAEKSGKKLTPEEINAAVEKMFLNKIPVTKFLPDISISTRLQVSWPRAIAAFMQNMLLGTGPSSLGEATDGDYFRWLGETGLLGTLSFLAIFAAIVLRILKSIGSMAKRHAYIFLGFLFGFAGLFISAGYIDLFEASKVAYTFWLIAGIFYAAAPYFASKASVGKLKI